MRRIATSRRVARGLAAICALAVSLIFAPALSGTAHADKVYGYKISRGEVIARAHHWLAANVPYSQTNWYPDPQGKDYRTDCSGFISMVWHLPKNSGNDYWTGNLDQVATRISKSRSGLKPGDMLLNQPDGHVVLFEEWVNKSAGTFRIIEQQNTANDMQRGVYDIDSGRFAISNYKAYRYKNIFNDGYDAANETGYQGRSGAECKYTRPGDPTIDLPNRRDVYVSFYTCIRREYDANRSAWRYHSWIHIFWDEGRDGDDSSNKSKKRFDGFLVHTQIQHNNRTAREVRCYLHNNINASYNGMRACNLYYYTSNNDGKWHTDGYVNWNKDGDGKSWLKPWYAHGSPLWG